MRGRTQLPVSAGTRLRGFSLIELLFVVAIILVLFVLMFGFNSKSQQRQQKVACAKNLTTILVSLEIFAREHGGQFPISTNATTSEEALAPLVPKYTAATEMFVCPGSKDSKLPDGESFEKRRISYAYYMGQRAESASELLMSDRQVNALPKPPGTQVFSNDGKRPANNHSKFGGVLLFVDGRTEQIPAVTPIPLIATQGVVLLNPR